MSITLPEATPPPAPGARDASATSKANRRRRILVVDDDTLICQIYSEALFRSGYQVDSAHDGEVGWQTLHAVRHDPDSYDLLITDNNMPKLSGVELVKKLRSERMMLPVIMATSAPPADSEELQLTAILPKPFYPDQLVQTVKEILDATHSSDASDTPLKM
ncbi:MAG: phoP 1 [Pedosphaera sp.]|nr:phoP 1 [Pedosphaera sp.]